MGINENSGPSIAKNDKESPPPLRSGQGPRRKRKRRRWVRIVGILLIILIVLVWLAPYLISTDVGTRMVLSIANGLLKGRIDMGDLSLSWGGSCKVRALRVWDPSGREVLNTEGITYGRGVLGAIISGEEFENVNVESPRAVLYMTPSGEISLLKAFSPRKSRPKRAPKAPPKPKGRITVNNGSVKLVRADGREYDLPAINAEFDLNTLNEVEGSLRIAFQEGGELSGEVKLQDLVSDRKVNARNASGTVRFETKTPVDLRALGDFAAKDSGLGGKAAMTLEATLQPDEVRSQFVLDMVSLEARRLRTKQETPVDLSLTGDLISVGKKLNAQLNISGDPGELGVKLEYRRTDRREKVPVSDLLGAALGDKSVSFPDFNLEAEGQFDLVAIGQAFPQLLSIRKDTTITGGKLLIDDVSLCGGTKPGAKGEIVLTGFTGVHGTQRVTFEPISGVFALQMEADKGLVIENLGLTGEFARLTATGSLRNIEANVEGDLGKLHRKVSSIFALEPVELSGRFNGNIVTMRRQDDRMDILFRGSAEELLYKKEAKEVRIGKATFNTDTQVILDDHKPVKVASKDVRLEIDDDIALLGSGWFDLREKAFHGEIAQVRGDIAAIALRAKKLGFSKLEDCAGDLNIQLTVDRAGAEAAIITSGETRVEGLHVGGEPFGEDPTKLVWRDVRYHAKEKHASIKAVELRSDPAQLTISEGECRLGEDFHLTGQVQLSADLEASMAVGKQFAKGKKLPAVSGQLEWSGKAASTKQTTSIDGKGTVKDLRVGVGDKAVREDALEFGYDIEIDKDAESIALRGAEIKSKFFTSRLSGTIRHYKTQWLLDLNGEYSGSWEELTKLLHELAPETADTISLSGVTSSGIKITGSAYRPEIRPVFREAQGGLDVGWAAADIYGLVLGKAKLSPGLNEGQVRLPTTSIRSGEGALRLGGLVDLRSEDPTLHIPGKLRVLDNVEINRKFATKVLSRINPIFTNIGAIEGKVSLMLEDISLPLGEKIKQVGSGSGHMDLSQLRIVPQGILATLLNMGGLSGQQPVQLTGVDFVIKDGRVDYDNFRLIFGGDFDLKFYGSVGFDESLDLVVSVPIRSKLLERFGVKGRVLEIAKVLSGVRVDIPIRGTRLRPTLDFSEVDIGGLLNQASRLLLLQKSREQLQKILAPKKKRAPETQPTTQPQTSPSKQKPRAKILELIFDLLGDKKDKTDKDKPTQTP